MTKSPLFAVLALSLASPLAFAQSLPQDQAAQQTPPTHNAGGITWEQLDADSNGDISKAEAARSEGLSRVFDQADANGDGNLTIEEYRAFAQAKAATAEPEEPPTD